MVLGQKKWYNTFGKFYVHIFITSHGKDSTKKKRHGTKAKNEVPFSVKQSLEVFPSVCPFGVAVHTCNANGPAAKV